MAQDYTVSIRLQASNEGFSATVEGAEADIRRFAEAAEGAARGAAAAGAPLDAFGRAAAEAGRGAREAGAGMREAGATATGAASAVRDAAAASSSAATAAAAMGESYRATAQLGTILTASMTGFSASAQQAAAGATAVGKAQGWMQAEAAAAQRRMNDVATALSVSAASAQAFVGAFGRTGQAAGATTERFRLAGWQANQLGMQLNDVATMAMMGASPFQILATQGGQVFQVFGSLGNLLSWFMGLLSPLVLTIGAVTAAIGLGVGAWLSYEASIGEVERAMRTGGRAIALTAEELEALAQQTAETENISVRSARSIQAAIAAAGVGSAEALEQAMAMSRDWAAFTGQDMVDAAADLGGAFRDLEGWVKKTEQTYGIYTAAQMRDIRNLIQQGDRAGAYARAMEILNQRAQNTADQGLGALGRAWAWIARQASDAWDSMGKIFRAAPLAEQAESIGKSIDIVQKELASPRLSDLARRSAEDRLARLLAQQAALQKQIKEEAERPETERKRQLGIDAQSAIDAADPITGRRREIENRIVLINKAVAEGVVNAQEGARAIALLRKEYADLADPLEKVGKAYGDALQELRATADAQERLAVASAGGTAAIREAELANEAHAFAARAAAEGWASYESAFNAAMAVLRRGDLAATTAAFNAWVIEQDRSIASAEAMAAATGRGSAAVAEATVQARIAAEVTRLGIEGDQKRIEIVEEKIRQEQRLKQVASYNTELAAAQDALQIAQAELALAGEIPEVRDRIITRLREELRLKAQFPELSKEERDALLQVLETTAATEARTKRLGEQRDLWLEPLKNAARNIQDAFAGAFRSIFSGGVDSFRDLGRRILDIMIETAAQIAALMVFQPQVVGGTGGGIGGLLGFGGGPSAGGGMSAGGMPGLQDVGKLFSLGSGGTLSPALDALNPGGLFHDVGTGFVGPLQPGVTAGAMTFSNVLGIAGAVLPGLISGNYAQAGLGGAGALIGTMIAPGIGTMVGGMFGNLLGGLLGKGGKDKLQVLSAPSRSGNPILGDTFDDGTAFSSPFGWVGLGDNRTSGHDYGFVANMGRAMQRSDRAMAQYMSGSEIETVSQALWSTPGYSRSDREFGEEEFGKVIRGRMRPILEALGIQQQLIDTALASTDAEELQQAAQELLARRAAVRDLIEYEGEEGEIRKAQRQAVDGLRGVLDELAAAHGDFGFSAEGAAAASRRLVEEFLGIADVVEPMSAVEQAIASLNERFEQAASLAAAVGIETPIDQLREQAMQQLREGFDQGNADAIRAMIDPLGFALAEFDKIAAQRIEDAKALGAEIVLVERRNQLERQKVIEQYQGQALSGLRALYDDLLGGGGSPLAAETVLANAEARYAELRDAALAGDPTARSNLQGAARDLLEASRTMFASAPEYWDRFDDVRETLERLLGIGNADPAALKPPPTPAAAVVDAEQFAPLTTAIEGGTQLSRELLAVQREAAGRVGDGVEEMRLVRAEIAALRREMNEHQDTVRRLAGKAA